MRFRSLFSLSLAISSIGSAAAHAQVHASVDGVRNHVWAGAEFSDFDPDYGLTNLQGVTLFASTQVTRHFGGEVEVRLLNFNKPSGETEKMFMVGPTYKFYQRGPFSALGKVDFGVATVNYPSNIGYGSYFAYEPGGAVEYQFARRWKARADYDFDFLPGAPGYAITAPLPSNGLTPHGFSIGVAYRVF